MSYDLYVWAHADGHPTEVLDAIDDGHLLLLRADPAVAALRSELLDKFPQLGEVLEPDAMSGEADRYLALTLPFGWLDLVPQVLDLARRYGLTVIDPQADTHGVEPPPTIPGVRGEWSRGDIGRDLGVSARWVSRAWDLADLPASVPFGQAVGAFLLAMCLRDGTEVDGDGARAFVDRVARHCAGGVPSTEVSLTLDFVVVDVTGYAGALARGGY